MAFALAIPRGPNRNSTLNPSRSGTVVSEIVVRVAGPSARAKRAHASGAVIAGAKNLVPTALH
jgi:hypothetical protein